MQKDLAYKSNEVSLGMVKETKKDKVIIKNHFKSTTQDELDMKVAKIMAYLLKKEIEPVNQ
jgi:hypothetical protein